MRNFKVFIKYILLYGTVVNTGYDWSNIGGICLKDLKRYFLVKKSKRF